MKFSNPALNALVREDEGKNVPEVNVGDGATLLYHTDRVPCTVIEVKRNGRQIVLQEDKCTRDESVKLNFIPGGFFGHVSNQRDQKWFIEEDPEGSIKVANWNPSECCYKVDGSLRVKLGERIKFYDYNF